MDRVARLLLPLLLGYVLMALAQSAARGADLPVPHSGTAQGYAGKAFRMGAGQSATFTERFGQWSINPIAFWSPQNKFSSSPKSGGNLMQKSKSKIR